MNDEELKIQLGANLAAYRRQFHLTQAALAEKLSYSDKAVSKWERGESVPDVLTLVQISELFGITVNDLLKDPNALPENGSAVERAVGKAVEKTIRRKADKGVICILASLLVWFVALLAFVVISSAKVPKSWVAFFYAVPVNAIVLLSLRSAWHDYRHNELYVSVIVWGTLLGIYMSLLLFCSINIWKVFLLGIPGQAAIFWWFRMYRSAKKEKADGQKDTAP